VFSIYEFIILEASCDKTYWKFIDMSEGVKDSILN